MADSKVSLLTAASSVAGADTLYLVQGGISKKATVALTVVDKALGTPTSAVLTNATGLPVSTGISGLGTNVAAFLATPSSANLAAALTDETGSGAAVFATSPTLVTPALGTPSAAVLTNATGLPIATGVSGLGTGVAAFLAAPSSANLATAVTGETGSGALVFGTSPTLVTPALGTPASGVATNLTGLPLTTGVTGILPVANGGTATATPSLVAGTNVTISGTWPNQTINSTGGGGGAPAVESIATGSAYTLVVGDANKIKRCVDASAQTINITTAFNGLHVTLEWLAGAGTVTLDANAGVNLNGLGDGVNIVLSQASGAVQLIPSGTNTWDVIGAIGDLVLADVTNITASATEVNYTTGVTSAIQTQLNAKAALAQTFGMSFAIDTVANQDYTIALRMPFAGTITETSSKCVSGTATATFKVNTTALGGTPNAVSSSQVNTTQSSSNTFVANDLIQVTMSANSSCLGAAFTIKYTRSLA